MNRHGRHGDNASFDENSEESSGVTSLVPVPVKPARLSGFHENDCTQYFSVNALLERGKAVAAREQQKVAAVAALAPAPAEPKPAKPGILRQIREASLARKASALLLPMLILLLVIKPVFKKPKRVALPTPVAVAAPGPQALAAPAPKLALTPPEPPPTLPRGVGLPRAAADAVAAGDFRRAVALYRELSRREPNNAAYSAALRILQQRTRVQTP